MNENTVERFLAQRNKALLSLDLELVRKLWPDVSPFSDEVLLMALHKARYECTDLPAGERYESAEWLRSRGYGRQTGGPLLPPGELPNRAP